MHAEFKFLKTHKGITRFARVGLSADPSPDWAISISSLGELATVYGDAVRRGLFLAIAQQDKAKGQRYTIAVQELVEAVDTSADAMECAAAAAAWRSFGHSEAAVSFRAVNDCWQVFFDLLAPYQNGYDGLLRRFDVSLEPGGDRLVANAQLQVVSILNGAESWFVVDVELAVSELEANREWFAGGGCVLYNGARLVVSPNSDDVLLDLEPGVAWLTPSASAPAQRFLVRGNGTVSIRPVLDVEAKPAPFDSGPTQ